MDEYKTIRHLIPEAKREYVDFCFEVQLLLGVGDGQTLVKIVEMILFEKTAEDDQEWWDIYDLFTERPLGAWKYAEDQREMVERAHQIADPSVLGLRRQFRVPKP